MESRQSRASSRYASPAVFNGPVRRWKKQWVTSTQNRTNKRNDAPPLLLCRWTPLAGDDPPRRRFRYTPVVPIEKGKLMENELVRSGGSITNNDAISMEAEPAAIQVQEVNEDEAADADGKKSVQEEE